MDGYPAWFPDGSAIAFSSDRVHDGWLADFWLIDADGSNLRQVTDSPGVGDLSPSVSPDGKSIVFETFVPEEARQVVRVDVDGRNQRNLSAKIGPDWGGWPTDWTHDGRILIATKGEV